MLWFRRLRRRLFGDERYQVLVDYAAREFGRSVRVDDSVLEMISQNHKGQTGMKYAVGGCSPHPGGQVSISSRIHGQERVFVLLHELGHAMDFTNPISFDLWKIAWASKPLSAEGRRMIFAAERRAFDLALVVAQQAGVDVDARDWKRFSDGAYEQDVITYLEFEPKC